MKIWLLKIAKFCNTICACMVMQIKLLLVLIMAPCKKKKEIKKRQFKDLALYWERISTISSPRVERNF